MGLVNPDPDLWTSLLTSNLPHHWDLSHELGFWLKLAIVFVLSSLR